MMFTLWFIIVHPQTFPFLSASPRLFTPAVLTNWTYLLIIITWPFYFVASTDFINTTFDRIRNPFPRVLSMVLSITLVLSLLIWIIEGEVNLIAMILFFLLDVEFLLITKRRRQKAMKKNPAKTLIVGAGLLAQETLQGICEHQLPFSPLGFVEKEGSNPVLEGIDIPLLGTYDKILSIIAEKKIKKIIITLPFERYEEITDVYIAISKLPIEVWGVTDTIPLEETPCGINDSNFYPPILKRFFDNFVTIPGLIIISPILFAIAFIVRVTSPGPAVFKQIRIGRYGKYFVIYKFRTMYNRVDQSVHKDYVTRLIKGELNPEDLNANSMKMTNDMRITGIGKILRNATLDELPQFFNVLQGDMSAVGPRPCMPYEIVLFKPEQYPRFLAMQGITGLWQVTEYNRASFEEMLNIDVEYVCRQSIFLDIYLVLLTPISAIFGVGRR
ncbi:MAG: sugar transferase [Anaerolineales bacterium]|nr:sugar transferase [Anaerolineales bacterium]